MNLPIQLTPTPQPCHTIGLGVFDGVHRGHQYIVDQCDYILTLHPHPKTILHQQPMTYLTTIHERRLYIPNLVVMTFSKAVSLMSADGFLNHVINAYFQPKKIIFGYDYRFGNQQEGTPELLTQWAQDRGIITSLTEPVLHQGIPVKSQTIRDCIRNDKFDDAIDLLGHPYTIVGTVVRGDGRGKSLGFPTANLVVDEDKLVPQPGVYGAISPNHKSSAIVYIGSKPTFEGTHQAIEVHIPGLNEDLYGQSLRIDLTHFIRHEYTFDSADDLTVQIQRDIDQLQAPASL